MGLRCSEPTCLSIAGQYRLFSQLPPLRQMRGNGHTEEPPLHITPLPKLQLFILLYLQLAEPITGFVIFPFINQLIFEYGITDGDEKKVGYYAGTVSSLFFLTEMVCVYHWGRLSDKIGRRPVLMMGVIGLICSSVLFGISKTFTALVLSRALCGALNGNIGVIKSMMAEITDESNQAQAFSFMPLVFAGGMSVASFIGGGLSHPYERFPKIFGQWVFWKYYPYALPCFVSAAFCISALVLAFFYLQESLNTRRPKNAARDDDTSSLTHTPGVTSPTASTPLLSKPTTPPPPPLREVLTPRVRIAIINYGTFSLLSIIYTYVQPLVMSTPIGLGGIGLTPPTIGLILGISGIINGAFQMFFFSPIHRKFGTRTLFIIATASHIVLYLSWPLMGLLARRSGRVDLATITVLVFQMLFNTLTGMGYSCTHIFITSAAPTRNTLGATTGLAQTLVSFTRAVGPTSAASLFAFSLERNLLGGQLVYLVLVVLVVLSLLAAARLPKVIKRISDENTD
ncbi:MFS general substrate transporter [Ramaria rubella]|nr:MFS general substrate transporter [Ramaria rubella]